MRCPHDCISYRPLKPFLGLIRTPLKTFLNMWPLYPMSYLGFLFHRKKKKKKMRVWDQMTFLRNHFFRDNNSSKPEETSEPRSAFFRRRHPLWSHECPSWAWATDIATLAFVKANHSVPGLFLRLEIFLPQKSHRFLPFAVAQVTQAP